MPAEIQLKQGRILIVDDKPVNTSLLAQMLQQNGYQSIRYTNDSRQALPICEEFLPQLILLDLQMPYVDGFEIMKALSQKDGRDFPAILVLTAQKDREACLRALRSGAKDFITKPFDLLEVTLRIKNLLEAKLLNDEILLANQFLEEKVQERTHDLVTTNQKLICEVEQRKTAENKSVLYAQYLEKKHQELSSFLKIASHDLQEPLRKVQTLSDLLETKLTNISGEEKNIMDRLRHAAARGSKLLDELTSFSSITSEDESPTVFNLSHLVHDVIFELRNRIDQTHGEIKSGDLPEICGNPRYIRSLFYHLISNALKFCKTDTPPRISISSQRTEDHQWQIFVKDNGLGIEKKYLEKIFKPFEKLNPKDGYGGMGMGLTICRKIAENHSGTIVAQSNPEEGTVFILTLPEIRRN